MSDAQQVLASNLYRLKVYTINNGQLQNSLSVPAVTIYDVNRNIIVSNVPATNIGTGIYEYVYSVPSLAAQGVWETVITTNVQVSQNIVTSDYWEVRGAPAQVIVRAVNGVTVPNISADVTITNEGSGGYEYLYEWCVVSAQNNSCGGGDDVSYGSAAKFIQPGEDWNTVLTANVPNPGNYYFKVVAYFGTESSGASRSFTAILPVVTPPSGGTGGGGGGGNNTYNPSVVPSVPSEPSKSQCKGADFNHDNKVNPIDFSILLYFWKTKPPFNNPCVDINTDNRVDSVDFSILLYQWGTGGTAYKK